MSYKKDHFRPASTALALEPRLMFDGAAAVAAVEHFDIHQDFQAEAQRQETQSVAEATADSPAQGVPGVLLIIDARVADHQSLLADLPANATVRVIHGDESGIAAVSEELAKGHGFEAVHIISHGSSGSLSLGSDQISADTLATQGQALQAWASHLSADADILLYGCDIAGGEAGQAFISELAHLTGADIAASTDATGAASKGGDWVLESRTGAIESSLAISQAAAASYGELLAATSITDSQAATPRVTAEDTPLVIQGLSVSGGASDTITLRIQTTGGNATVGTTGLTFTGANGSVDFSVTGTIADVNAALASLSYSPTADQNSSVSGFSPSIALNVTSGGAGSFTVSNISVTAVNDAPSLATKAPLAVNEGGNASFSRNQLASSDNALDVDIATGQQVIGQQMVIIDSLPAKGTLSYLGGAVAVGQVVPVSSLGSLSYTHNGSDIAATDTDSFNVTVSDGGGKQTPGSINITINPVNKAPTISGSPSLIEGQVKGVAPTIDLGDTADTLGNSTISISNVVTGGQGALFLDTDNDGVVDAGEEITGTRVLTSAEAANLLTQLKFAHNGAEPNAPGAIAPAYRITVTDAGGGTGVSSAPVSTDITIDVRPNNDDPTLTNQHATPAQALAVVEGTKTTTITGAMLKIADADRDPSNLSNTTPANQLVYTIGTRPAEGEIQVNVGGGLGPEGDGWIVLGDGGRFTQAQVDAGQVRYYQTTNVLAGSNALDSFTFTVRDSAFGYDVWTDPANPTAPREGGLRDTPTGLIALQQFHLTITPLAAENSPRTTTYEGTPRPATSGFGGTDMVYTFEPGSMTNGNSGAVWNEANVGAAGGYVITDSMLKYVITRTDTKGTGDKGDDVSVTVPENETVYTLTVQPPNGVVQRNVGGTWVDIPTNGQFTQADIQAGSIRFVHDGSENHTATFGYKVSDGTPNNSSSTFALNVTPTNDRPTASGSGSAQVVEGTGAGSITRLDASHLGMGDIDLSQDVGKRIGEGAQDFLWFQVTAQPVDGGATPRGTLERWNGSAWVAVTPGEWLPSTLLAAPADGGTSGLRYRHDGSEPLAYTGGPKVAFSYTVRDDLADPANAFTTSSAVPVDTSGSAQSNVSGLATVTINITPVNDAPQVADKPSDADPAILETIAGGGAKNGGNEILAGVLEGSTSTITNAYLAAVDRDNTTTQRQFRITSAPSQGTLLLDGAAIGVGSTFTQADIDAGKVAYRHNGAEITPATTDGLGTYNDKFHFVVNDGVLEDSGAGADKNVFLITLAPTNDKPTVTGPSGPITIDSATAGNNPVPGFSVDDPDWTNPATSTDFVQVTVRLQDSTGTPITNYTTGFAGGGVQIGYGTGSGVVVTQDGNNNILQFQGTKAQVNAALAGLTVTFANDANALYKLEVIVDDRMRNGSGALVTTADDANGGEVNQPTTPGGATTPVDASAYDWKTTATVPVASGNIASTTVDLRASRDNQAPIFTGPGSFTVNEDVRSPVGDGTTNKFVVSDAESTAFGTPVTVTVSVPSGTLHIGPTGTPGSLTPAGGQAVTIGGQGTGSITLTGRADDIEAVLNGRNFADTANDGNTGLHYISAGNVNHDLNDVAAGDVTLTLSFSEGTSAIGSDVGSGSVANTVAPITTALTINAINDAPVVATGAGAIAIAGAGATAVPDFVVNDVDATDGYVVGESDGTIQATVRVLNQAGAPLSATQYGTLGITLGTTASGHGATVDATLNGATQALELRGTRDQINAYLAGLQVTFANLGSSNLDALYKVEVVADDRLRDAGGVLSGGANGGSNNQKIGLPAVPATDTFDPYATTVSGYAVYNVTSNTRDLFISSINDPGKITANNVTVAEGSATLDLTAANANIVLDDSDDNGASTMEVTVTVGAGTITAVGGSGGTVTGLNTNAITITGATEAEINARLKALTVTFPDVAGDPAAADWNGSFDVTITYNDKGNTGTRPGTLTGDTNDARTGNGDYAYNDGASNHLVTTRIITVTVTGVNDAPTRTAATVTLPAGTEDTDGGVGDTVQNLFGGTFSDAKDAIGDGTNGTVANTFAGIAITTNNAIGAQGKWQYSINGGASWVDLPAVSDTSAFLLDPAAKLRFDPADNFHGTPGGLVTRLVDSSGGAVVSATTANVSGANSGGSTRYSDGSNAVTLGTTVANVNDRPTATNGSLTATEDQKDASAGAGTLVSNLGTTLGFSDTTDNQTPISGGGNAATVFGGIAIVGNTTSAGGKWQYSTDGTTWNDLPTGLTDANALVLPTSASVRFNPTTADYNGTPTGGLQVRVADTGQTFASGSALTVGATSTWSDVVTLGATVAPRNDAPGFTHAPTSPTVTENATTGSGTSINAVKLLGSGAVTDIDLSTTPALSATVFGAGSVTVTLTDGITGDLLRLDGLAAGANGIATMAGGTGSTALVVTFTNAATVAQVEAVLAAIEYTNTNDDPTNRLSGTPQTQRNYTVVLSDGNNVQSGGNAGGPGPLAATKNGTITINATNDPPLATPNTNAVTEDSGTPATGNVKTNGAADSDTDNDMADVPVTAIVATTAGGGSTPVADNAGAGTVVTGKYGTLTIHPDGSYSYALDNSNPDVNALNDTKTLDEVFTYTITDPGALSASNTLTITINGHTDGAPQIVPVDGNAGATGQATVYEKGLTSAGDTTETTTGTITVTAPDGVAKVTIGGHDFTVAQLEALSAGSPSAVIDTGEGELRITGISNKTGAPGAPVSADVSYTYTLKAQQNQPGATESTDTIALVVTDKSGAPAKTGSGNLVIQILDDAPTATDDARSITRGSATVTGNAFTNDRIGADGPQAVGAPVTGITGGTLGTPLNGTYGAITLNADGTYSYALDNSNPAVAALLSGQKLTETFTYTITDKDGDPSTTTITITVNGLTPNALPVAVDDAFTLNEDQTLSGTLTDNDAPSTDGGNVWAKATDPQHGKVVVSPDGRFTYVPDPDYHGPDSFTYTITDVNGDQSTATVTLTVLPVNDVPVAVADSAVTGKDKPVSGSLSGNDKPSGDGGNVWAKATDPANGTVLVNPDGSYTYTPRPGFAGEDRFTYTVTDKDGDTSTATVTITVVPNDVPVAVNDRVSTPSDKPVSGSLSGNDKPSGDGGNVWAKATDPANGTAQVNPDGSYTYTPRPGFAGEDRFTYTVTDKDGDTSTATVTITVVPNDVPVAVADRVSTPSDKPVSGSLSGNDKPSADGGNVWAKATDPANGTVQVNPDGSYTYTPRPGFAGEDRFTYTVTDKDGDTSTATVTIEVVGATGLPVQPPVQPPQGSQTEPRPEPPAMPDRLTPTQPVSPLQGDPVRDPSVFFDGALVTSLPRLSIPLHPIVYVTPQVNASQAERENSDPLFFSNPRAVQHGDMQSRTIGAGLGMDPALFVQHAVRDSQARGALLGNIVDGRLPRLSLGSDGSIPTPQWFEPDPSQIVPELPGERPQAADDAAPAPDKVQTQRADASPAGAAPTTARPAAAPSFSEQLRNAGGRAPAVAARQASPVSFVS